MRHAAWAVVLLVSLAAAAQAPSGPTPTDRTLQQIDTLRKLIDLTPPESKERPDLLYRMGALFAEEERALRGQALAREDERIAAARRGDEAGARSAKQAKEALTARSREFSGRAIAQWTEVAQQYPAYPRIDELLFGLATERMENGDPAGAVAAYEK